MRNKVINTNGNKARPVYNPKDEVTGLTSLSCVNAEVKNFHQFWQFIDTWFTVKKVAQGSYASVLRMTMTTSVALYTVWKVMPIKPKKGRGSRRPNQTLIEDAAAEVKALACMQEVDGFVDFRSAQVVRGSVPEKFRSINSEWTETHPDDSDDFKYPEDQLWLLIEMTDAGTDLETLLTQGFPDGSRLNGTGQRDRVTFFQVWDIFWSIAEALAHGEAQAEFEHRDLHPGNICIKKNRIPVLGSGQQEIERHTNLQVTLIDYTLSRAKINETEILVNSMKDQTLFTQESQDAFDNQQYETYRHMRNLVMYTKRGVLQENALRWKEFVPVTNVIWLFHILWLLLCRTEHYPGTPRVATRPNTFDQIEDETERDLAKKLETVMYHLRPVSGEEVWRYLSATEVVDYQMGRLKKPFGPIAEGDSEAMKQLRLDRSSGIDHLFGDHLFD